jgi:hypothetical protein
MDVQSLRTVTAVRIGCVSTRAWAGGRGPGGVGSAGPGHPGPAGCGSSEGAPSGSNRRRRWPAWAGSCVRGRRPRHIRPARRPADWHADTRRPRAGRARAFAPTCFLRGKLSRRQLSAPARRRLPAVATARGDVLPTSCPAMTASGGGRAQGDVRRAERRPVAATDRSLCCNRKLTLLQQTAHSAATCSPLCSVQPEAVAMLPAAALLQACRPAQPERLRQQQAARFHSPRQSREGWARADARLQQEARSL